MAFDYSVGRSILLFQINFLAYDNPIFTVEYVTISDDFYQTLVAAAKQPPEKRYRTLADLHLEHEMVEHAADLNLGCAV